VDQQDPKGAAAADTNPTVVAGDILQGLRGRVTKALTDGSRNNPLIYFRESRSTRFVAAPLGSEFVRKLLAGETVRRADFSRDCPSLAKPLAEALTGDAALDPSDQPAPNVSRKAGPLRKFASPVDPLGTRLRAIRAKARENEEERGLRTLFAAIGMVSWPSPDGGRPPEAPLFLVPIAIFDDPRVRGDLAVQRLEDGEAVVNRALLTVAPRAFSDAVEGLFDEGEIEDVAASYAAVGAAIRDLPGISLEPTTALGIFNFQLMAMVDDLHEAGDALEEHVIIRALAGDAAARDVLVGAREGAIDVDALDQIAPVNEPFVLDADPWQGKTIQTLLQYPDSHATVDGPPGTGKSQTIANLIAALIAQGKSVLFVCEKRAALDVVKRRLTAAGLGHLLLDMHGAAISRQRAYAQLRAARAQMRDAVPASSAQDAALVATRDRLNAHVRFMHTQVEGAASSPYQILSELAALPAFNIGIRISAGDLRSIGPDVLAQLESDVGEAARNAAAFLRSGDLPWATSNVAAAEVPAAVDRVGALAASLKLLRRVLREVGKPVASRAELTDATLTLAKIRGALQVCGPGALDLDPIVLQLALDTLSTPFGPILELFSASRRTAMSALQAHLREGPRARRTLALRELMSLEGPWRQSVRAVAALTADVDVAAAGWVQALGDTETTLGAPLPEDLTALSSLLTRGASEREAAYRAARMREIEGALRDRHLGALMECFTSLEPGVWTKAIRYVYFQSYLEPLRPALARFDGRTQDDVVAAFRKIEAELRTISRDRVCRAAGERYVTVSNAHREQQTTVNIQLEKARPRKSLRALYSEAADAMLALAPCVMASPLSISQFLPRATIFDVIVFDEGSQVTPESAITAILRGRRVVIAGDDRQLPPTDFFGGTSDDDEDEHDDRDAVAGTESILTALRSFTKDLGLRVHYRSRDERLIAFSNNHLYNNELITFPGSGTGGDGLRFVLVDPTGSEIDEDSSRPEVARVVELIIEHAETRPNESLGVIALGLPHARRIDVALAAARRERPDLDAFFSESGDEPFFVKNLERVQGDERTAVILTMGYGRTKTGSVSHNFGPINQQGGERRLNVAITRAKSRLTLVSSFRKSDLNPSSLTSIGPKLLAAYLGYAESKGTDLGHDGVVVSVAPNAFELDIQQALEARLKTGVLAQYGVGRFRLDLAVQDPREPGRFVLAVECDGASYHSTPTARMRDRLRQTILENLGWHFVRIWSTDWFNNRAAELERIDGVFRRALEVSPEPASAPVNGEAPPPSSVEVIPPPMPPSRTGQSPARPPYDSISDVGDRTLKDLAAWIASDGRLRTNEEMIDEMIHELGFRRRGARIVERLEQIVGGRRV
jgi:very-short-patch-repair endonuclease